MIGFILALISAIGYSLNQIFNKKLLKELNLYDALLLSNFNLSLISFLILLFFGKFDLLKYNLLDSFLILITGIIGFIALIFLFKSFKFLSVGETLAIVNINPFIILLLSWIILKETISLFKFITMIIVSIGIILLIRNKYGSIIKSNHNLSFNYFFPFLTAINWGIEGFIIYLLIGKGYNIFGIVFIIQLIILLLTINLVSKKNGKIINKKYFNKNNLLNGFFAGLFTNIGILFYSLSLKFINPAISSSISSTQILFAFIFSSYLLNEKFKINQIIPVLIILFGLVLFNF